MTPASRNAASSKPSIGALEEPPRRRDGIDAERAIGRTGPVRFLLRLPLMAASSSVTPAVATAPSSAAMNAEPAEYDENGVDLSLVRYSLSLTPTQRLKAIENFMNAMTSVRRVPPAAVDSAE